MKDRPLRPTVGPELKSKAGVEGFGEPGVEGVEVSELVRGNAAEGQSASRPVQVHCYSASLRIGDGNPCF